MGFCALVTLIFATLSLSSGLTNFGSGPKPEVFFNSTSNEHATKVNFTKLMLTSALFSNTKRAASLTTSPRIQKMSKASSHEQEIMFSSAGFQQFEWESILVGKLFDPRNYNPQVRPATSMAYPVAVSIELVLLQINEMIEKDQEVVVSGFIKMKWRDIRLQWNSGEFGGIQTVVTSSANCWLPDLALINSNDVYRVTRDTRFPLTADSSGQILYVPAGKIFARCELNLRYFPFDYQLCKYRFESWAYAAELVTINGLNFTIEPEHYMQNPEWEIPDSFVKTEIIRYETFNFSRVDFYMVLKRKSLFFITYTIFPCVALSTLQLMSHMLPFTEPERINFATTTLIAFSVFHVSIVEQMPHSSDSVPLLAIFVDALMCIIGLSLIECFFMMNWLSRVGLTVPSPSAWYYVVDKWGDYLWLGSVGNYWRRNYLYVYERLNHKLEVDRRRRELERQRWSMSGSRKKKKRLLSVVSGVRNNSNANLEALAFLADRNIRVSNEKPFLMVENKNFETSDSGGQRNHRSLDLGLNFGMSREDVSEQNPLIKESKGATYDSVTLRVPKPHQIDAESRSCSSDSLQFINRDSTLSSYWGHKTSSDGKNKPSTIGELSHLSKCRHAKASPPQRKSYRIGFGKRKPKHKLYRHHVSEIKEIQKKTVPKASPEVELQDFKPKRDDFCLKNSPEPHPQAAATQHSPAAHRRRSEFQYKAPAPSLSGTKAPAQANNFEYFGNDMKIFVEEISTNISNSELRKECLGIWTTFITVVDRMLSIFLCILSVSLLFYLFFVFPKPPDLVKIRRTAGVGIADLID